ncbi:ATP-binding protein [Methylocella sp.]|uniref:ATP-binding response regulator n=1 Tax=Methylocella sp. TaxID=1978226 RepID=UPI0037844B67
MPTTPTRILLIDDDQVDRAAVRRMLARSGLAHELVEAADGAAGLRAAQAQDFDCVLLDYRLPDVDAFDLLAELIAPTGGAQGVMMLTGEADQEIALRLMRAGALDYLAKNEIQPQGLARAIRYARARRASLAEIESARREAEEKSAALDVLNRQKSVLFSIIAHDLRNPFQAILGLSHMLTQAVESKEHAAIERRARGVRTAAEQAVGLMESLFAWASLQMDQTSIAFDVIDVGEVAREAVAAVASGHAEKGVAIEVEPCAVRACAQADMLATVLRNLVSNAVKFTRPGGLVRVGARRRGERVEMFVADTGVGMAPERVADLFRLDRRVTSPGTAGERGSGMGLLLCRDLVERLGGALKVESAPEAGTTFSFDLPGAQSDACAERDALGA